MLALASRPSFSPAFFVPARSHRPAVARGRAKDVWRRGKATRGEAIETSAGTERFFVVAAGQLRERACHQLRKSGLWQAFCPRCTLFFLHFLPILPAA